MNETQHSQFGEPEWGGHYTAPHMLKYVRMRRYKARGQCQIAQRDWLQSCSEVGRGSRAALPDEAVPEGLPACRAPWQICPGCWAGYCDPAYPASSISFPFLEGRITFSQSFPFPYHSCLFGFQVLRGTNCFMLCISVACRRGKNYSWLEFLGSTLTQRW